MPLQPDHLKFYSRPFIVDNSQLTRSKSVPHTLAFSSMNGAPPHLLLSIIFVRLGTVEQTLLEHSANLLIAGYATCERTMNDLIASECVKTLYAPEKF